MRRRERRWIFEHTVYMARRFLARLGNYHRQHPATGQSGILFSKLPRLNQRIALNGVLLVIPPSSLILLPSSPTIHAWIIHTLDSILHGGPTLWKSVRNTGSDYNSVHRAARAESDAQGGIISI